MRRFIVQSRDLSAVVTGFTGLTCRSSIHEETVFEKFDVLLGGEYFLDFCKLLGTHLAAGGLAGIGESLTGLFVFFLTFLTGGFAVLFELIEFSLLIGSEVETLKGIGCLPTVATCFATALGATVVAFVVVRTGESRGCYEGTQAQNCYDCFLVHSLNVFINYILLVSLSHS